MNKRNVAIIAEIVPILSTVICYLLIRFAPGTGVASKIVSITVLLAFLGFVFFFVGRALCKGDKVVKILGIFDILSTLFIVVLYVVAFFAFGL